MHPAKWSERNKKRWSRKNEKFTVIKESLGIVYNVAEDGLMTPAWEVEGIYPRRYISGMFPYFPEQFTFYVSNDGNKVVSITKKRMKTKELISIYDRSGIVTKLTKADFKASLFSVHHCGGIDILGSTHLWADDILELTARVKGNKQIVYENWKMSVHTGKLIKSPN